jgi:hypothetical protein
MGKKLPKETSAKQTLEELLESFAKSQKSGRGDFDPQTNGLMDDMEKLSVKYGAKFLLVALKSADDDSGVFATSFTTNMHGKPEIGDALENALEKSLEQLRESRPSNKLSLPEIPEHLPEELKRKLQTLKSFLERDDEDRGREILKDESESIRHDLSEGEGEDELLLTLQNLKKYGAKDDNPLVLEVKKSLKKIAEFRKKK